MLQRLIPVMHVFITLYPKCNTLLNLLLSICRPSFHSSSLGKGSLMTIRRVGTCPAPTLYTFNAHLQLFMPFIFCISMTWYLGFNVDICQKSCFLCVDNNLSHVSLPTRVWSFNRLSMGLISCPTRSCYTHNATFYNIYFRRPVDLHFLLLRLWLLYDYPYD